jgi:hypothetical protein
MATIKLPQLVFNQPSLGAGRIQFRDAGFVPKLVDNQITLGPGQMAMIGFGDYATEKYDFGVQDDVVIPRAIAPITAAFHSTGKGSIEAAVDAPSRGILRVIIREKTPEGFVRRTWAGGPPSGENMGKVFAISAEQAGRSVPVSINYDKIVWSGMSWAVGEIDASKLDRAEPLTIRFHSSEKDPITLDGQLYLVEY